MKSGVVAAQVAWDPASHSLSLLTLVSPVVALLSGTGLMSLGDGAQYRQPTRGSVFFQQNHQKFSLWVSLAQIRTWAHLSASHCGQGSEALELARPGHVPISEGRKVASPHTWTSRLRREKGALLKEPEWILNPWQSECQPGGRLGAQNIILLKICCRNSKYLSLQNRNPL